MLTWTSITAAAAALVAPVYADESNTVNQQITRSLHEVNWDTGLDCNEDSFFGGLNFGRVACSLARRTGPKTMQQNCLPRMWMPAEGKPVKGVILAFHGYTACPDTYLDTGARLAADGFYVFAPLNPGHGRLRIEKYCNNQTVECTQFDVIDELPTNGEIYAEWVEQVVKDLKEDSATLELPLAAKYGVLGLSLGSALTTYALSIDGGFFSHGLIVSPYYGINLPNDPEGVEACSGKTITDEGWYDCLRSFRGSGIEPFLGYIGVMASKFAPADYALSDFESINNLVRFALAKGGSTPGLQKEFQNPMISGMISAVQEAGHGWGHGCEVQRGNGRGGYCTFKLKNYFAVHAMGQKALLSADNISTRRFSAITVERDGAVRNGLVAEVLKKAEAKRTGMKTIVGSCVYPVQQGSGTPHACFSRVENGGKDAMFWEADLFRNINDFFRYNHEIGIEEVDMHREACVRVDTSNFPIAYYAPVTVSDLDGPTA